MYGHMLAAGAGFFAALSSVFGKLAMASDFAASLCQIALTFAYIDYFHPDMPSDNIVKEDTEDIQYICESLSFYVRVVFFGLIFLCNTLMWTLFVRAMQACSSTVEATIINTASNLVFTALLGRLLFGEVLSLLWCAGMTLIVVGMVLITRGNSADTENKTK